RQTPTGWPWPADPAPRWHATIRDPPADESTGVGITGVPAGVVANKIWFQGIAAGQASALFWNPQRRVSCVARPKKIRRDGRAIQGTGLDLPAPGRKAPPRKWRQNRRRCARSVVVEAKNSESWPSGLRHRS